MRLANEIAAAGDGPRRRRDPSRHDGGADRSRVARASSTARAPAGPARSTWRSASPSSGPARGSGRSPRPARRPVLEGEPTLFEIWVCADGYWADHTKNVVVGELTDAYRELETGLREVYDDAVAFCTPGASLAELDRRIREGIERIGYPGQPSHPICHGIGARAHEPPYAHQAGGGEMKAGMVLAIEPGCYWEGGGGLRLEDNFLVTTGAPEKLSPFPDGIVEAGR